MPEAEPRHRPPRRVRRPQPAPPRPASVAVPVVGLLAFVGLVGIGFLVAASRRRDTEAPHHSALPVPHMPALPHVPSFDLHWIGRLAAVSAAQAAISHLVQSALRTWK
jgi:hypothetical protein